MLNHTQRFFNLSALVCLGLMLIPATVQCSEPQEPRISAKGWAKSRYYQIDSDAPIEQIRHLGKTLDTVFQNFQKRFGKVNSRRLPLTVRFLKDKDSFATYGKKYGTKFNEKWQGYYSYKERGIIFYYKENNGHMKTAIHEAFHQFMHLNIDQIGWMPPWFNEGAAEYLEGSTFDDKGRMSRSENLNTSWVKTLKHHYQKNSLIPLTKLFQTGKPEWSGESFYNNYATAYAFVHYLVEADRKHLRIYQNLLKRLAKGMSYQEALSSTFEQSNLIQLEATFHQWLHKKLEAEAQSE